MNRIIEADQLRKSYGSLEAVKGISFYVEQSKLFAFLGPNGAGKSTTIDMICTFLAPDSGTVTVDGHVLGKDDDKIRTCIGVVFQENLLDPLLTIRENLVSRGGFYGLKGEKLKEAVNRTAELTGVTELLNRPYGKLSGGQRRRCDIARALIHTPKILFLDEPTTGLDPQTRRIIWQTIQTLQKDTGMTVFLTTHYMEEAAEADYIIVIDNGTITAKGTPDALKEEYASDKLKLICTEPEKVSALLQQMDIPFTAAQNIINIKIEKTLDSLPILDACRDSLSSFEVLNGTMDDAFIAITGKELREV